MRRCMLRLETEMRDLELLLEQIVAERSIPSISLVLRVEGGEVFHRTVGLARRSPERVAAVDQPYDLASVTKAIAGSTVAASLVQDGVVALDEPVAVHLPRVDDRVTLRHLLNHSSGYPAWRPLYEGCTGAYGTASSRSAMLQAAQAPSLEAPPGRRYCYSDLGFMVMLAFLETAAKRPFDLLFRERIIHASGVNRQFRWGWPGAAATEMCPVRGFVVEGVVHDLNCAALGGVSTHAGLFATARGLAELADRLREAAAGRDSALPGEALDQFWSAVGPGSHCLGWDTVSRDGYTSTGRFLPRDARGHLGYTGTSLWIVPSRQTVIALLTNRVHPFDEKETIREIRPVIHDAVAAALGWTG